MPSKAHHYTTLIIGDISCRLTDSLESLYVRWVRGWGPIYIELMVTHWPNYIFYNYICLISKETLTVRKWKYFVGDPLMQSSEHSSLSTALVMPTANRRNGDDLIVCDRSSIVVSQPIIAAAINFVALKLAISQIINEISHTTIMLTAASDSYNYVVVPK